MRSMSGRTKFMRMSGCRHTIDRARVTMPAARRVTLKSHQLRINFLDGMLLIENVGDCALEWLSARYPPKAKTSAHLYELELMF